MPVLVKDYSWTQTESKVYISVPLKGMNAKYVDIFATDEYLKVHFPPFLFETFLFAPVDDDKSIAKVGNGVAVFTLLKQKEELWDQLCINNEDKEKQKEIRQNAILKAQEKATADSKAKTAKKQEEKKFALQTMMKLEEKERAKIQEIKHKECEKAVTELEIWKLKHKSEKEKAVLGQQHNTQLERTTKADKAGKLSGDLSLEKVAIRHQGTNVTKTEKVTLPAPRLCGSIKVNFTHRVFPTAMRESRVPEEEEWLKKQAEARRAVSADLAELDDLKPEERNPDWLKEKGDKLFVAGNYQGASYAYSLGLKLNRKLPSLFSNRAACHLKLRNLHKAVEDSSKALELLTPPVSHNATARLRAHVRRGTAFCELELYIEGLQDYQAALKIDPGNAKLQEDAKKIKDIIQGTSG